MFSGIQHVAADVARGEMAFLLTVSVTPLLAMLPGRKGSCPDR